MAVIKSRIDTGSAEYVDIHRQMLGLVDEVRKLEGLVRENSGRSRAKFEARGQLLPRERLRRLIDPGSTFVEFSTLAGYRMHDDNGHSSISGGGLVTGIGQVAGAQCVITLSDCGIKGGAVSPMGLEKTLRAQQCAMENKLPMIGLIESAGANLLHQAELFVRGGRSFYNQAQLSAMGLPQIMVVHGSSTAGGAYIPGLADYVIMVRERAKVFLAGPPLLKAATGEIATDEELGGADMHADISGTAEYVAGDDAEAITIARDLMGRLEWPTAGAGAAGKSFDEPLYDSDELLGLVPVDYRKPYDVHEVIARLVDGSDFMDFKPRFGSEIICGFAAIEGLSVGLIGNNGPIFPAGSQKAAQFIQACCQAGRPIVYLQNTTGYMVGKQAEADGAVKHGSKMIQAVSNATVPQITLMIGASFGAGNYGMCGRSFGPRFVFSWPNSRIAVMGGEQVAKVMEILARAGAARKGADVNEQELKQKAEMIVSRMEIESSALYATARLWDDGVIDPRDSRRLLGYLLRLSLQGDARKINPSTFGVARM
ncbi:MAG: acyl-CoA carboxylase subunit beta [Sphingomonadales bacterium]